MDSSDSADATERWYAPLGPELSQGDLVDVVPTGLIDAPLTICQPPNRDPSGKSRYYPYEQLPQRRSVEFIHATGDIGRGLVIWPDCQIDKPKNLNRPLRDWFVGIAAVHPMERLPPEVRDNVRRLNRAQFFPLPAKAPEVPAESYVDLRYIWPVRYSLLSRRIIAASEEARNALAFQTFWFITEVRIQAHVKCPHCDGQVDASAFFAFKDDGEAED